jgi:CubicO group peptidase (beta-lactamase class C family)
MINFMHNFNTKNAMSSIFPKGIFLSIILSSLLISGLTQEKSNYQLLDQYISDGNKLFEMPGMAVGIIKDGKVVFNKTYGYTHTGTGRQVTPETVFGIASCSKAFTAACIAILVDEGKLDWTDKVIDHYPEFRVFDPYITREMEIQDLLGHRSGYQTFDGDLLWYGTDYSRQEVLKRLSHRENPYSFRSRFGYQNLMFIAAGEVIAHVTGMSWDNFVAERIFEPLGMYSTSTTNTHFTAEMDIAWPHIEGQPVEFINYDNCGPAASMNSTVVDLMKWLRLLLGKGSLDGEEIFSQETYYKMVAPITPLNAGKAEEPGGRHFFACGLGWFLYDYQGRKIIEHGGGLPGFHSKVVFVPEENLAYVILANQLSGLVEAVYRKILDFHLNLDDNDYVALFLEQELLSEAKKLEKTINEIESRVIGTLPALKTEQYAGIYEDKMYGLAEVIVKDDSLSLTLLPTAELFTGSLQHWHHSTSGLRTTIPFCR